MRSQNGDIHEEKRINSCSSHRDSTCVFHDDIRGRAKEDAELQCHLFCYSWGRSGEAPAYTSCQVTQFERVILPISIYAMAFWLQHLLAAMVAKPSRASILVTTIGNLLATNKGGMLGDSRGDQHSAWMISGAPYQSRELRVLRDTCETLQRVVEPCVGVQGKSRGRWPLPFQALCLRRPLVDAEPECILYARARYG